ncbi:MAG: putative baseplate assembly protein [Caldilineaceae bacterium]
MPPKYVAIYRNQLNAEGAEIDFQDIRSRLIRVPELPPRPELRDLPEPSKADLSEREIKQFQEERQSAIEQRRQSNEEWQQSRRSHGEALFATADTPRFHEALYFGFENDISCHILRFDLKLNDQVGAGPITSLGPEAWPYVWEVAAPDPANRWIPCECEYDRTQALQRSGYIQIHVPEAAKYRIGEQSLFWVRLRYCEITREDDLRSMRPYGSSPRLVGDPIIHAMGRVVNASNVYIVENEVLGVSDGTPGQKFYLQSTPILKRDPDKEYLQLQLGDAVFEPWVEQENFADSGPHDRHFTLDSVTGELQLGPAIRQSNGEIRLYGAIPPRGAVLSFTRYRRSNGYAGNVAIGTLNTPVESLAPVRRVSNRAPAKDGRDAESVQAAAIRAPKEIRYLRPAVTADDFEFFAREALPEKVARAVCLAGSNGQTASGNLVKLRLVPKITQTAQYIPPEQLEADSPTWR